MTDLEFSLRFEAPYIVLKSQVPWLHPDLGKVAEASVRGDRVGDVLVVCSDRKDGSVQWGVMAEGLVVGIVPFESREEAEGFADEVRTVVTSYEDWGRR